MLAIESTRENRASPPLSFFRLEVTLCPRSDSCNDWRVIATKNDGNAYGQRPSLVWLTISRLRHPQTHCHLSENDVVGLEGFGHSELTSIKTAPTRVSDVTKFPSRVTGIYVLFLTYSLFSKFCAPAFLSLFLRTE